MDQTLHYVLVFLFSFLGIGTSLYGQGNKSLILNINPYDYERGDYVTSPQNWGITQHSDGRLFVANTSGVLVFDGESWEMIKGTENLQFFKFAQTTEGRIFTGGSGELGYFSSDSLGQISFQSLKDRLPEKVRGFERVYRVDGDGKRIFFLASNFLFI